MNLSPFNYSDYKDYLRDSISHFEPRRGGISRLAEAAGCQPAYLSQVLKAHVHLTPDQALLIGQMLNLSPIELDGFLLLVDLARAAGPKLKERLKRKVEELKQKNQELAKRLERPAVETTEHHSTYYSNWLWCALHVLVDIPAFQTAEAISKRLGLEIDVVSFHLSRLENMGFIKREKGRWRHSGVEIHLPKTSPFVSSHHNNWRQQAVLKSQMRSDQNIHFTGVYAIGLGDFEKLKEILLRNLAELTKRASQSPSEELVCINQDFFKV